MGNHASRIGLLHAEPDLARFMTEDERLAASKMSVPVETVQRGTADLAEVLSRSRSFGAIILEGMLLAYPRVGEQVALRLLGPGDVLSLPGSWQSSLLSETRCSAAAPTTLALLGNDVLVAARRWPRIVAGLHVRLAEQSDRLAAQLAICQLPRVDQRLLAIMWLLAESWGQVTSVGTRLPLNLTHDALGALIGARRPTVTLALGELTDRGAIIRQERGWLLLERPVEPSAPPRGFEEPLLFEDAPTGWAAPSKPLAPQETHRLLVAEVGRLRAEHVRNRERVRRRLTEMAELRRRSSASRRRIAQQAITRRGAPS